jgi:hypothetical protein
VHTILAPGRLKQEDLKFEASLGCTGTLSQKKRKNFFIMFKAGLGICAFSHLRALWFLTNK